MRLFIAAAIDNNNQEEIRKIQDRLKEYGGDVKWVEPKNTHLTLRFLGQISQEKVPGIINALKEAVKSISPFSIEITRLGVFPNIRFPRIIWAGIEKGQDNLRELSLIIDRTLLKTGFPQEKRPFSGHISLGRARNAKNKTMLSKNIAGFRFNPITQAIGSIILYKSALSSEGPAYDKLHEENLIQS